MMFVTGLKNFFKNLKYFIVPIGVIALFFLFGISIAVPATFRSIRIMIDSVKETTASTSLDFNSFLSSLATELLSLDWNNQEELIKTLTSQDWLINTFKEALIALIGEESIASVTDAIFTCILSIFVALVFAALMLVIGIIVGYLVLRSVIRNTAIKGRRLESFLYGLLNLLIIALLAVLTIYLFILWPPSMFISVFVLIIVLRLWHIFLAWLQFGRKHIKFEKVFNFKNTAFSILADTVIITITFVINWLLSFIISNIFLFFVSLAIVEIMMATNAYTIRSYVVKLVEENTVQEPVTEESK